MRTDFDKEARVVEEVLFGTSRRNSRFRRRGQRVAARWSTLTQSLLRLLLQPQAEPP